MPGKKEESKGALVKVNEIASGVQRVSEKTIMDYLFASKLNVPEDQKVLAVQIAVACQLNPFKREIHFVPRKDSYGNVKVTLVTGYEVYIKRADRTGKLDGWRAWTDGEGKNMKAFVEIRRKDFSTPFQHEVDWAEFGQTNATWGRMPKFMLKKVAIAQGFRMAFSDELAGMPYTADELPDMPDHGNGERGAEGSGGNGNGGAAKDPAPTCPRCGAQMFVSKYQNDKTAIEYYCSAYKTGCKEKFKVLKDTGEAIKDEGKALPAIDPDPEEHGAVESDFEAGKDLPAEADIVLPEDDPEIEIIEPMKRPKASDPVKVDQGSEADPFRLKSPPAEDPEAENDRKPCLKEQRDLIDNLRKKLDFSAEDMKVHIKTRFSKEACKDLTRGEANDLIKWLTMITTPKVKK